MTEIELEQADRYQLIKYLVAHVSSSAGNTYKDSVHYALQKQGIEILRSMAIMTCRQELERQKRRADQRAQRRKDEHKNVIARGAH